MAVFDPLLRHITPETPPYPTVHVSEGSCSLHKAVILHPALQVGVELLYHLFKGDSSGPPRYGFDAVFNPSERLGRELDLQHLSFREAEAQEAALMAGGHGALLPVHLEFEAFPQKLLDRLEHPFSGTFRLYIDIASSSAGESPPHALTEPDVNVSAHPALTLQPWPEGAASGQTALADAS